MFRFFLNYQQVCWCCVLRALENTSSNVARTGLYSPFYLLLLLEDEMNRYGRRIVVDEGLISALLPSYGCCSAWLALKWEAGVVFCGASEDLRFLAGAVDLAGETKILFTRTLGHSHNDSGVREWHFLIELSIQHASSKLFFTLGIWVNRCPWDTQGMNPAQKTCPIAQDGLSSLFPVHDAQPT